MSDPDQYTVGWICALETEYVAARAFLEKKHSRPERLSPNDNNHYTLGEIGGHQVVIAVLPDGDYGTSSAAGVARDMLHSFPNVRFGLMVGIGGGVPTKRDIRLGDIVVSSSRKGQGGLLQYDLGKELQGQGLHQTGFLNQPPLILRTAVAGLQAQYEEEGHRLKENIQAVLEGNKRLKRKYAQPSFKTDQLFKSEFTHPNLERSCGEVCDSSKLIYRLKRPNEQDDPFIHYGLIASGNRVIKDATFRDKLAVEQDVLCFETEAAGLMNHFPCLVIRGVCDYADSHKSKEWQGWAAMVAAAYARDLLYQVVPRRVDAEQRASQLLGEILQDISNDIQDIRVTTSGSSKDIKAMFQDDHLRKLLPAAEGAEFGTYMTQHEEKCLEGTRTELLLDVKKWGLSTDEKFIFWLNGLAGTGKSTISRSVAKAFHDERQLGASFFFKRGEGDCGNATRFFPTIAMQLLDRIPDLHAAMTQAVQNNARISVKPLKEQFEELIKKPLSILKPQSNQGPPLVIVIDALDECEHDHDIEIILQLLPRFQEIRTIHLRLFITSRPEVPIRLGFQTASNHHHYLVLHEISQSIIEHDISLFFERKLARIRDERGLPVGWPGKPDIQALITMSVPLFIFAATVCRLLKDHNLDPEKCLSEILQYQSQESKLDETYLPVLDRLVSRYSGSRYKQLVQDVRQVIGAIILLESPLSITSLSKLMGPTIRSINASLSSLHSVVNIPNDETLPVRPFHASFRDFLLDPSTREKTPFYVDARAMNQTLTVKCLHVMHKNLKKDICGLKRYGTRRQDIDTQSIKRYLPPELQYSCRYWTNHLARAENPIGLARDILAFLKEHLLHWAEVMSMLGNMSEVIRSIGVLQSVLQYNKDSEISQFLYDAKRFILKNSQMADIAPLQLYASAILFAPHLATTRRDFERELPSWIIKGPEVEESWSPELQTLIGHSRSVQSVAFSSDGRFLASGSDDKTIKLWDPANGTLKNTLEGHLSSVCSVAFSPDSQLLASGSGDQTIKLWDPTTGVLKQSINGVSVPIISVAFSPDGRILASGSFDNRLLMSSFQSNAIQLWDPITGTLKHSLEGHLRSARSVTFSPDGQLLTSSSDDGTIKIWDPATGALKHTLGSCLRYTSSVTFSPDGQLLASGSLDKTVKVWVFTTGAIRHTLEGCTSSIESLAFSPDGRLLAASSYDKTINLWDPDTGVLKYTLEGDSHLVQSIAFSPGGFLASSSKYSIKLWNPVAASCKLNVLESHSDSVRSLTFSTDGQFLASGSYDRTIKLWHSTTGALVHTLKGHSDQVQLVIFSPDGQLVASSSDDETIKLWSPASGNLKRTLGSHLHSVQSLVFSPDSQLLAASCSYRGRLLKPTLCDNNIKLWDPTSGALMHTLEGHLSQIQCVAFSPDGQLLASGSIDKTIRLWDPTTGQLHHVLEGHSHPVQSLSFSPNSRLLGSRSKDYTVKVWDSSTGGLKDSASAYTIFTNSDRPKELFELITSLLPLDVQACHEPCSSSSCQQKIEVSFQGDWWVIIQGQRELWLPSNYEPTSSAVKDGTIALGCRNGRVCIMKLSI